jgi:tetratricopeptide (TPR) repeat protein
LLATQILPAGLVRAEESSASDAHNVTSPSAEWLPNHQRKMGERENNQDGKNPAMDSEPEAATMEPSPAKITATAEARRKAVVALNTGHYQDAIKALEEAYALDQDPKLLFSLAQAYRLAGQSIKALEACSSYLRSADPSRTDRLQADLFLAEVTMIAYQIQLQHEMGFRGQLSVPATTTESKPASADLEPLPLAANKPKLDLTPRPPSENSHVVSSPIVVDSNTSPEPQPVRHFYENRTLWVVTGAVIVLAGAGLGIWAWERSRELKSPSTGLGYQTAFP